MGKSSRTQGGLYICGGGLVFGEFNIPGGVLVIMILDGFNVLHFGDFLHDFFKFFFSATGFWNANFSQNVSYPRT